MSFWQSHTKVRKSDQLFSVFIRCRDGDCAYRKKCQGGIPFKELTNSHYFRRRYESLRYEPANCDAACRKCHFWTENTPEGQAWLSGFKVQQLGQQGMLLLEAKKKTSWKHDPLKELAAIEWAKSCYASLSASQKLFAKNSLKSISLKVGFNLATI